MNRSLLTLFLALMHGCMLSAQQEARLIQPISFGVVLDHPGMKNVKMTADIPYLKDSKGSLHFDLYAPAGLKAAEKRPAIIFLNAIGERAGEAKLKSWGIYSTWPKLMAAYGYMGISMECDGSRIPESIEALFSYLDAKGATHQVDASRLGVYAASANVTQSSRYLMGEKAYKGIKAAVLYYGNAPTGPFRKDLPVLFIISEGDAAPNRYNGLWNEVLKNNAPWTIKMGTGMPHAFDAFSDNDEARKIIKETISFWQNHLDPVPSPAWTHSKARDILGTIQMDRPKAISMLQTMAEEHPKDVSVLSFYANALRQANRTDESAAVYRKWLAFDPKSREALIALAVIAYSKNNTAEADGYVAAALNAGEMNRNDYAQLGFSLLVAEKNREAAVYFEKALAMEPRAIDFYNLGCAYAKINEKDKAFKALDESIRLGYNSKQQFENDGDLTSLRTDERYKSIIAKLQ